MFAQVENRKGEKLYIFTISNTNSIKPYTYVNTWEECLKLNGLMEPKNLSMAPIILMLLYSMVLLLKWNIISLIMRLYKAIRL